MSETDYSKRELDTLFSDIKEQLNRIEQQTMKTNGSVASLKQWRAYITGALSIIGLIVLPILGYLALQEVNLNAELQSHIQSSSRAQTAAVRPQ